jgi:hypothetical protein
VKDKLEDQELLCARSEEEHILNMCEEAESTRQKLRDIINEIE